MRIHIKKKIIAIVKTLDEAHSQIKKLCVERKFHTAVNLMATCQDTACAIYDIIEMTPNEGIVTIKHINDYFELLYNLSESIKTTLDFELYFLKLNTQVHIIEKSIVHDIPSKIEVVFLPYKASMWDSFESVWYNMKDNAIFDVYVIPIPYYDKINGEISKWHYEGNQFPNYVNVENWKSYDLENRHPDVIFIHNPYDEMNRVTSVDSDYYSDNLKKHTDLLAYIPYYVLENESAIDNFILLPGEINADKVFLQSESLRQIYVDRYKSLLNDCNLSHLIDSVEEKFVATGSPKFDKVINSDKENDYIPEPWKKLIYRLDGTQKKIILYNTSISSMLQETATYLIKLQDVLNTFKKNEDIVLLWRPHPLTEATLKSMRPNYLSAYTKIVEEYKREGWGIYDDSVELNRAIAISSAYYGDYSSLVIMYMVTGKLVLIQNINKVSEIYDIKDDFEGTTVFDEEIVYFCVDDEYIWFTTYSYNALYRANKKNWVVEYVTRIPAELIVGSTGYALFGSLIKENNKLFIAPLLANNISIYDLESKTFEKVLIEQIENESLQKTHAFNKFQFVVSYGESVFFTPHTYPAIVQYNITTKDLTYHIDWLKQAKDLSDAIRPPYISAFVVNGASLIMTSTTINIVYIFDMKTYESSVYEVGTKKVGFSGIGFDGENCWIASNYGESIVKWNPKTKVWKEFYNLREQFSLEEINFSKNIICIDKYAYFLPDTANKALKVSILDNEISIADEFQDEFEVRDVHNFKKLKNIIAMISHEKILFSTGEGLEEFDIDSGIKRKILLRETSTSKNNLISLRNHALYNDYHNYKNLQEFTYKEGLLRVNNFIDLVIKMDKMQEWQKARSKKQIEFCSNVVTNLDGTAGKFIVEHILHELIPN